MNIIQLYERFPTQKECIDYLEIVRWAGVPVCFYCKSDRATPVPKEQRYHCNNCKTSFSVTVGTIFHHTHIELQKWFFALSLMLGSKKAISGRQLAREISVSKDTAISMRARIFDAMAENRELLSAIVGMCGCYLDGTLSRGPSSLSSSTASLNVEA